MGTTYFCINSTPVLTTTNWISILGIIVNSGLAIWIVRTIQNKLTNKRTLKDHFINEVKDIRNEYKTCLSNLYSNQTKPKKVIPWFKLMNIKVDDLMLLISTKYKKVERNFLNPYQIEIRELITENDDFISKFESDDTLNFSENSKSQIIIFQQKHNHLFNDVIILINDAE